MLTRCFLVLLLAAVFGAANGVGVAGGVPNAGWAWAALPVVAGAVVRRPVAGAVAGSVATLVALTSFSVLNATARGVPFSEPVRGDLLWWAASVTVCPLLGLLGTRFGRPGVTGLAAVLVVPVGAALEMLVLPRPVGRWPVFAVAIVSAGVAARWWSRSRG